MTLKPDMAERILSVDGMSLGTDDLMSDFVKTRLGLKIGKDSSCDKNRHMMDRDLASEESARPVEKLDADCVVAADPVLDPIECDSISGSLEDSVESGLFDQKIATSYPTLSEVADYFEFFIQGKGNEKRYGPVIGERRNSIIATISLIQNNSFMIVGDSGSGKSALAYKLLALVPDSQVYTLGMASDTAVFSDYAAINRAKIVFAPEIQKALSKKNSIIEEFVKDITEGMDSTRKKTGRDGVVIEYIITKDKLFMTTCAFENDWYQSKRTELLRRLLVLQTTSDREHIEEVVSYQLQCRSPLAKSRVFPRAKLQNLQAHVQACMSKSVEVLDPFTSALCDYLPKTPKALGYNSHYLSLLNGLVKFDMNNVAREGDVLFAGIQHHFLCYELFFNMYCDALEQIDRHECLPEIQEKRAKVIDWKRFFERGLEEMQGYARKEGKTDIFDDWLNTQFSGNVVSVFNPITKRYIKLF